MVLLYTPQGEAKLNFSYLVEVEQDNHNWQINIDIHDQSWENWQPVLLPSTLLYIYNVDWQLEHNSFNELTQIRKYRNFKFKKQSL